MRKVRNISIILLILLVVFPGTVSAMHHSNKKKGECVRLKYKTKYEKVLRASEDLNQWSYLAFPSVLHITPSTILISYKPGQAHGGDPGAKLEIMRYDIINEKEIETRIIGDIDELIFQMGEWVKFPNGDIVNYVDVQKIVPTPGYRKNHRTGIYYSRSQDGGKTFGAMRKMQSVNGIEYGYAFEDIIVGPQVYLLGRDYTTPFSLNLYKFDPETLQLHTYAVLDQRPGDAYYAEIFFTEKNGETFFNTITYVKSVSNSPDIVRLEFLWKEINGIAR